MALENQDKSRSKLLRQGLVQNTSGTSACPDPQQLAAYYERSVGAAEMTRFEMHLSNCGNCRERLAAMVRADESAPAATSREEAHGNAWLWNWRWLAPAAAVLAISIFWLARRPATIRPATNKTIEQQPLVAMSQPVQPPAPPLEPQSRVLDRVRPSPAELRNQTTANAKKSVGAENDAAQNESKKEMALGAGAQGNASSSQNQAAALSSEGQAVVAPVAPPASTQTLPSTASPGQGEVGGIVGGNPSSVAGQQQSPPPITPELVTGYSTAKTTASLRSAYQRTVEIRSPDPQVLWRVNGGGNLERSTDGGITWQNQQPAPDARLLTGVALSSRICWVAGRNGIILLTRDGANWATIPPPAHADLIGISARDDSGAIVTTADGRKFVTHDAGKNWQPAQ